MKKHYSLLGSLTILVVALLVLGSHAYADDTSKFNHQIQVIQAHRAQVELKMGLDPQWVRLPHATSYYDDLADHYEQEQLMFDKIDEGIR
jgi:hypothetical protein